MNGPRDSRICGRRRAARCPAIGTSAPPAEAPRDSMPLRSHSALEHIRCMKMYSAAELGTRMDVIQFRTGIPLLRRSHFAVFGLLVLIPLVGVAGPDAQVETHWKLHPIDRGLSGGDGVRLHDADGDGDLDVAVGWEQAGVSRLYLNPGAGQAAKQAWPKIDVGSAAAVEDAVMADLDADGRMDVISSTEGGSRKLIVHFAPTTGDYADSAAWSTVEFPKELAGDRRWMFATTFDVDEDGHLDIVAGGKGPDAKIAWLEAPPADKRNLASWRFHAIGDVGWVMSLVAEDMDGDGDTDLVVTDRRMDAGLQGARWLENPGVQADLTAAWRNHFISVPNVEAMFLRLHDMDGDGDRDVVVPLRLNEVEDPEDGDISEPSQNPSRLRWYERLDGTGRNWQRHEIAYPADVGKSKGVAVGDVDGDGRLDIVVSHASARAPLSGIVRLSYQDTVFDRAWKRHEISGPAGSKYDRIELLDFDGDGDLDAITTEENFGEGSVGQGVIWYENPGA